MGPMSLYALTIEASGQNPEDGDTPQRPRRRLLFTHLHVRFRDDRLLDSLGGLLGHHPDPEMGPECACQVSSEGTVGRARDARCS
jgi:hypothetical protein